MREQNLGTAAVAIGVVIDVARRAVVDDPVAGIAGRQPGMEGIGIWGLYMLGHDPVWFVLLSGFVFFAWGEIYSLFPSTCTDTFGAKFATTNAGLLYTAKGTAALLVPIGNYMQQSSGNWDMVFWVAAGANILASLLAIAVLKPWRKAVIAKQSVQA